VASQEHLSKHDAIRGFLLKSLIVLQASMDDARFIETISVIADAIVGSMKRGGKLLTCGNGGSAADSQHISGEFISRLNFDRAPLASVALTTDTSAITAVGNDYGYERIFERQVLGLGRPGDVLLAISTSGKSSSVLNAMRAARERSMIVVAFTGDTGGLMPALAHHTLYAPSRQTPLIQQVHITAAHIICGLVEAEMFPR
jgi:D-sedoheptulose 7-phosphate isomerase